MEMISNRESNILTGNITRVLFTLSVPIILSNFIQTLLGIVDMIWIGKLGSEAVSAIGTASFYVNFATALTTLVCIGSGVKIAHSIGSKNENDKNSYIKNGFMMSFCISVIYVLLTGFFANQLINFFDLRNVEIEMMAIDYLKTSLFGIPILFIVTYYTTVLTSMGKTKVVFLANSIGLLFNIIVDPILIFGFGPIPPMGVVGAAWATNYARLITLIVLFAYNSSVFLSSYKTKFSLKHAEDVLLMGLPVMVQRIVFIFISMVITKIIVRFGSNAIAVQKIGLQIESISYVTIGGLQGAIAAFIGQNYGYGNWKRIRKSYSSAIRAVMSFSVIVTLILFMFPRQLFSIFINDEIIINMGAGYMKAIAFSQLFMCVELLTVGAFNGIGKTYVPPLNSILITIMRIPLSLYLSSYWGISGIWWSISLTSVLKGTVLYIWFKNVLRVESRRDKHNLLNN